MPNFALGLSTSDFSILILPSSQKVSSGDLAFRPGRNTRTDLPGDMLKGRVLLWINGLV